MQPDCLGLLLCVQLKRVKKNRMSYSSPVYCILYCIQTSHSLTNVNCIYFSKASQVRTHLWAFYFFLDSLSAIMAQLRDIFHHNRRFSAAWSSSFAAHFLALVVQTQLGTSPPAILFPLNASCRQRKLTHPHEH